MIASGSANEETASSNEMPCFRRLLWAFLGSQTYRTRTKCNTLTAGCHPLFATFSWTAARATRSYAKDRPSHDALALLDGIEGGLGARAFSTTLTLLSNDAREFKRIAGLRLENWASA